MGEIHCDEFREFIGENMRIDPVVMRREDNVQELLAFYMREQHPRATGVYSRKPRTHRVKRSKMARRIAVYAGTFDPLTTGHADIIERTLALADELHIVVAHNIAKTPMYPLAERVKHHSPPLRG